MHSFATWIVNNECWKTNDFIVTKIVQDLRCYSDFSETMSDECSASAIALGSLSTVIEEQRVERTHQG